jgi:hypothetical protein
MYRDADLSGVDLRDQDISFLVSLNTNFKNAILTNSQRAALQQGQQGPVKKNETLKAIQDARVILVSQFIDEYSGRNGNLVSTSGEYLQEWILRSILLSTVNSTSAREPDEQFGANYVSTALSALAPWAADSHVFFFLKLFKLFGDLLCLTDRQTIAVLDKYYVPTFGEFTGDFVACMRATKAIDEWWILEMPYANSCLARAQQISKTRPVHISAVDTYISQTSKIYDIIEFLSQIDFEINADYAEKFAFQIVSNPWPASQTKFILSAKLSPRVCAAIYRQLLAQGDERRIANVVEWIDDGRGAAGAISLENAFIHIKNFDIAFSLAKKLSPRMKSNQRNVIDLALSKLAVSRKDMERLREYKGGAFYED